MNYSLIAESAKTSEKDFEIIYNHFYGKIFGYLVSRLGNQADAEDLNSEVWMKILKNLKTYDSSKSQIQTWIFTIVRNALTDRLRKKSIRSFLSFGFHKEEAYIDENFEKVENKIFIETILRTLSNIPEKQRECIQLKYFSDMKNKEIAATLGVSEKTVASNLVRGITKLKELCKHML
jgi:RNA polymerase sigma factor (sigma-70 family)